MRNARRLVPALLTALSLTLGACSWQQVTDTVTAAGKLLDDPVVRDILNKVVLPLVPLDTKELTPLLDKAFTTAQIIELYRSTMGGKIAELPTTDLMKQINLQGPLQFGILSVETMGLGDKAPQATLDQLIALVMELFDLKGKGTGVEPTQVLPPMYGSVPGGAKPTPSPTQPPHTEPSEQPGGSGGAFQIPPAQVDLRNRFGKARSQGPRGTCNLFAMAQLLDYYYPERGEHSPEFLDWLYNLNYRARVEDEKAALWNVDEGTYTHVLIPLLTPQGNPVAGRNLPYIPPAQGAPLESEVPYKRDLTSSSPNASPAAVAPSRLGADLAGRMGDGEAFRTDLLQLYELKLDLATLKGALAEGNPIRISYPCKDDDWQPTTLRNRTFKIAELPSGTSKAAAGRIGYHAVLLAGYQDDGSAPGGGWFLLRNSWKDTWGDKGYAWISYAMTLDYAHSPVVGRRVDGQNTTTFATALPPDQPPKR